MSSWDVKSPEASFTRVSEQTGEVVLQGDIEFFHFFQWELAVYLRFCGLPGEMNGSSWKCVCGLSL